MDKLSVYKNYFETAKDDTLLVMHRGYALALVKMIEQLKDENEWLYSNLNQISNVIEKAREKTPKF